MPFRTVGPNQFSSSLSLFDSGAMDEGGEKPALLKELHRDLARKYQLHGTSIEQIWRSLS